MRAIMIQGPQLQELVERARQGDRAAFDELAARLHDVLLASVRRRLGVRLRERMDPEDVLQETFLRALRSISEFQWRGEKSLQRWLEGIAANCILHSARQLGLRTHYRIERDPPASDVSPSRECRRHERFDRLEESVEKLAPVYRTVVRLSRIEGLKIDEIAERMNRSPDSVRNLLFRAMKQLRQSFGDTESLGLPDRRLEEREGEQDAP